MQEKLLRFNPTLHFRDEKLFEFAERFIMLNAAQPKLFYIWGHHYELDAENGARVRFEEFCKMIVGKNGVYYGTNGEVLLNEKI